MSITLRDLLSLMADRNLSDLLVMPGAPVHACAANDSGKSHASSSLAPLEIQITPDDCNRVFESIVELSAFKSHPSTLPAEAHVVISERGVGRFRAFIFQQRNSHAVSIRRIFNKPLPLQEFRQAEQLQHASLTQGGLVIVGDSDKSHYADTLAALIQHRLAQAPGHIVTAEDSIDILYYHSVGVISQRELGIDVKCIQGVVESAQRAYANTIVIDSSLRTSKDLYAMLDYLSSGGTVFFAQKGANLESVITRFGSLSKSDPKILERLAKHLKWYVSEVKVVIEGKPVTRIHEMIQFSEKLRSVIASGNVKDLAERVRAGKLKADDGVISTDETLMTLTKNGEIPSAEAAKYASGAYYRNALMMHP
jgi:Tfp pilus assembly ATPase PilU